MKHLFLGPCVALILSSLSACNDSPSSASDGLTGTLKGTIRMRDRNLQTATDLSGVTVTLESTGFSATTDLQGNWTIDDLPAGTYDITYSKQGYGTLHEFGFQFVGGGTAHHEAKYMFTPLTEVEIASVEGTIDPTDSKFGLDLEVTPSVTTTQQENTHIFVIISRTPSSSIDNYAGTSYGLDYVPVNRSTVRPYRLGDLRTNHGFDSGDTAYIKVYSVAGWYEVGEETIFASHSTPMTTTVVIP